MTVTNDTDPGIYGGVPMAEYLALDHASNSRLKWMRMSPAHYRAYPQKDTVATMFGSASHCVLLEPAEILANYYVLPDVPAEMYERYKKPRATNKWKGIVEATAAVNEGKTPMEAEDLRRIQAMNRALLDNDLARHWLQSEGDNEVTIIWDDAETGVRCKGRIDIYRPALGLFADYKSTRDVCGFDRQIAKYGYHVQMAFYLDGLQAIADDILGVGMIAQEKDPPFAARAAMLDGDSITAGRQQYRAALQRLAECREADEWPGPDNPPAWRIPDWAMGPQTEIDFSGIETEDDPRLGEPGHLQKGEAAF